MSWMSIPYQKHFLFMTMHKTLEKIAYPISSYAALHNHEAHFSSRGNRRHHIQSKSGAGSFDSRSLPLQRPGGTRMKIRTHTGFILKVDNGAFFLGPFLNFWKNLLFPLLNKLRITLVSTIQRFLTTEPKLMQKAPHRSFAQLNSKLSFNRLGNNRTSPKSEDKFELPGVLVSNRLKNPQDLGAKELFRAATTIAGAQSMPAICTISGQPIVDISTCKPKCLDDFFRTFSCLHSLDCSNPYFFHCLGTYFSSIKLFHTSVYSI